MTKGYHTPRKKKIMPDESRSGFDLSGSFSHMSDRFDSKIKRKKRGEYF